MKLNYQPRDYFLPFHNRTKRFSFVLAHRRAGKSFALAADMVVRALNTKKHNAQFAYCAPSLKQAKTIIWKHFKTIIGNDLLAACKVSETTLSIIFPNGSEIRVFGLNDPDALRGFYLDGIVIDEAQDTPQELLSTVILPALADRQGWFVMSGTPKGTGNSFYRVYKKSIENPEKWFTINLPVSITKILSEDELQVQRDELAEEDYEQEFNLSFTSGNKGSILSKYVAQAEADGRVLELFHNKLADLKTVWDLGRDATICILYQVINGNVDIIDCKQWLNDDIDSILFDLKDYAQTKGYKLKEAWLPHDAYDKHLINGKTLQDVFWKHGFDTRRVPEVSRKSGINAARQMLKICRFNNFPTFELREALTAYSYKWSDTHQCFSAEPIHNWASHPSDAFRYLSLSVSASDLQNSIPRQEPTVVSGIPNNYQQARKNGYTEQEIIYLGIGDQFQDHSWFD